MTYREPCHGSNTKVATRAVEQWLTSNMKHHHIEYHMVQYSLHVQQTLEPMMLEKGQQAHR